jgi:hypothetical protein
MNYLPGLARDLCLLSSYDDRCEPPALAPECSVEEARTSGYANSYKSWVGPV